MLLGIQIINIHESFFFAMFFHCQQLWPPKACGYGFIATTHGHWYPRRRPSACDTVETDVEPHGFLLRILAPEFSSMSACEISSYAVIPMVSSSDHFRLWATFFFCGRGFQRWISSINITGVRWSLVTLKYQKGWNKFLRSLLFSWQPTLMDFP